MIACPTCSHPVASSAKTCPRCGHAFGALGPEYAAAFAAAPLAQKIAISVLLLGGGLALAYLSLAHYLQW